jgi:hypothetical protein
MTKHNNTNDSIVKPQTTGHRNDYRRKSWDSPINVASVKLIYGIYQPSLLDTQTYKNKEVSTQMITTHRNKDSISGHGKYKSIILQI